MRRTTLSLLLSSILSTAFGQSEYIINDFSDSFYARVIMGHDKVSTITIKRKKDDFSLLKVESQQIDFDDKSGKKIVLYKDQSAIVYDDFNFDGEKDLAIQEFFSTKGPAYLIYLFQDNSFKPDIEFTRIIQNSQGNYELNPVSKTIKTTSSDGCCSHSSATFVVKDGDLFPLNEKSEEIAQPFTTITTREWKDGKKTTTIDKSLRLDEDPIMSFDLVGNKKKVVLFDLNDRTLNYALVKANDKVEFNYPTNSVNDEAGFTLSASRNELTFKNASAEYKIYQKVNTGRIEAVGILVKAGGKEYDLKGDVKTLKGSLKDIPALDNLVK